MNPIDKDKTTEIPNTISYPHHIGSPVIKPIDMNKVVSIAYKAMEEQTTAQLNQIYEQIELLVKQAQKIKERIDISKLIYSSKIGFEPIINKIYHLYKKDENDENSYVLSIIGPTEWGSKMPYNSWISSVQLLSDRTWKIISENKNNIEINDNR